MNFSINSKIIQNVVRKMGALLTAKVSIPILSGVLLEVTEKAVLFTVSDGSESMVIRVAPADETCVINTEGKVVLPKDFFDVTKKLNGFLDIELQDTSVTVKKGKTELHFIVMDAEEYPRIAADQPIGQYKMTGTSFEQMVSKTAYCASTNSARPVLQAVHATFGLKGNHFVCTDSHRLGIVGLDFESSESDVALNIPAYSLTHAVKSFDLEKDVFFLLYTNQVALANSDVIYYSQLLEGNYPDTKRLLPETTSELVVNRQELIDTISLLSSMTQNSVISLEIDGLFVKIEARGDISHGASEIAHESYQGDDGFKIAFSAAYMLDALKAINSPSVKILFAGNMRPFLLQGTEESSALQLILPVRSY